MQKRKKILYFGNLYDETHYLLCFVGGCIESIAFLLLFHSLLGFMTANTLFGIADLLQGEFDFSSVYHLLSILVFLLVIIVHKYLQHTGVRNNKNSDEYVLSRSILIKIIFFFIFLTVAHIFYINGFITKPNVPALFIVSLGIASMYMQNYALKSGHPIPTSTSVMTGNYVLLINGIYSYFFNRKEENRIQKKRAMIHHIFVFTHFIAGAVLMVFLHKKLDFLSLLLPLGALLYIYYRALLSNK